MRPLTRMLAVGLIAALPVSIAVAQGSSAFTKFRDQHKYTFQLRTMVTSGMMECERSPATKIKPAQAKQFLTVLKPLRTQPKLTQDQAKAAIQKVQRIYEAKQLAAVDKAIQQSRNRRGGGGGSPGGGGGAPGAGGRPGGGGPPGGSTGARAPFDPNKLKNFNPFNPKKDGFGGERGYERNVQRNKSLFSFLEARAAGKAAKLDIPSGPGGRPGGGR